MSDPSKRQAGGASSDKAAASVRAGGWEESQPKARRRKFPGPAGASEPVRVAIEREAYADIVAHAKDSLDKEICGVLIGELCEDDQGPFTLVEATIRGSSAREGATHVTFTQDTWNQIHSEKERDYPKKQIVGWYHSHPGFGVEFSEMDRFIQQNFFSGPAQVAFVTDPLGGQEAILANSGGRLVPVSRFWVEGRERRCHAAVEAGGTSAGAAAVSSAASDKTIREIHDRIDRIIETVEAQHLFINRVFTFIGMFVAVGVVFWIASIIWSAYIREPAKPPEVQSWVPVPVQVGDKTVMLGVGVAKWEIPNELNAAFIAVERERRQAEDEARKKAGGPATAPATAPSGTPPKQGNP